MALWKTRMEKAEGDESGIHYPMQTETLQYVPWSMQTEAPPPGRHTHVYILATCQSSTLCIYVYARGSHEVHSDLTKKEPRLVQISSRLTDFVRQKQIENL